MPPASIPAYSLYGERDAEQDHAFCHIETIAARSALHDWEIAPHRHHRSAQVLIIVSGAVAVASDSFTTSLSAPAHVTIPMGTVHGFRFTPGTAGWVLTLGEGFAARAQAPDDPLRRLLLAGGHGPLAPAAAARIAMLAEAMRALPPDGSDPALGLALAEALLRSLPAADPVVPSGDRRLALFRHLIETHLAEHRPVRFYAGSLGMTERTLARLCQHQLGCTPLEAIHRRLAAEAQRLLRYTNASVAQVADTLGFVDPSYFSRFYLRQTGRRPAAERGAAAVPDQRRPA
ncbi:MAG: helix-turn-helix domain-containing protein [Sphingomonadales bacterium]|nr:helix-turn-helix domain-containing protein [Sphingomonadales bacterium]